MRALPALTLVASCAWSCAHPARGPSSGRSCDVLPVNGAAALMTFAADPGGGIALGGDSGGRLRAGAAALDVTGGFILRTNADGAVLWIRPTGPARPLALTIAPDGGTLVVGQLQRHCFAARLDGQGREVWASTLAGDGDSACRAVAFDDRTGDLWAAGEFTGALGPARAAGLTDAFVVRISGVSGEMRLVRAFGGKGAESATALALAGAGDLIVAGTFGRDVDASLSEVNFGRGPVRAADGTDGFVLALQPDGGTRWVSMVGEHGDDEVVAVGTRESAVYAAANLHRPRDGARCGGQAAVLRNRDWVRVDEDECVAARALAFDDAGRLWVLENAGRTLRARAFASTDGVSLGTRTWAADRASVRGIGIARVPGGFAAAATTDGELTACGKPVGSTGERTPFVVWVRDVTQ
jgi:hypothetical protein